MARPVKHSADDLLDAALTAVRAHGTTATIAEVSEATGAPVGSIYHRFGSREQLFVQLWLRSVRRFHVGLLASEAIDDPRAALLAQAEHVVRFCVTSPDDALGMTLHRHARLAPVAPEPLREEVRTVNDAIWALGRTQVDRLFGRDDEALLRTVAIAVRQCPYGLVRPFVGGPVPVWLPDAAVAASAAILDRAEGYADR